MKRIYLLLIISLTSVLSKAQEWSEPVEILDTIAGSGITGYYSKMIRVGDYPAIAYQDYTHTRLYFVRALNDSGTVWSEPIMVDNDGSVGSHLSIAIVNGKPAIAYHDALRGTLRYVRAQDPLGNSWGNPVVVDNGGSRGKFTSLAFINGIPMIAYQNYSAFDLLFVKALDADGNTWDNPQTLVSVNSAGAGTFLMNVNGNPALAFNYSVVGGTVRYMRALDSLGTQWGPMVYVDGGGYFIQMMKIGGVPVIAHLDPDIARVRYVKANDANGGSWGAGISIGLTIDDANYFALDTLQGGIPAVCYNETLQQRLQFTRANNVTATTWTASTTVSTSNYPGFHCSMLFQKGGFLIAHHTQTNKCLNLHRSTTSIGNVWNFVHEWKTTNKYGEHPSIVEINGNPAIAYYNYGTTQPCFVRAIDETGLNWPQAITPIGGNNRGEFPDMAIVDGNPAISYYNEQNEYVVFQRANDALGTNWNLAVDVHPSSPLTNANPLIMNSDGFPAIAFHNNTGGSTALRYRRGSDAVGTAFTANPGAADPQNACGFYASYAEVNGTPALAYYDLVNANLRYTRAQNANASGWINPVVIDSQGDVGKASSLFLVNGKPAVTYFDATNLSLKYVRALDENGTSWGIPQTLYSGIASGQNSNKLFIYNNLPVILFQGTFGMLYMMKALDANGDQWSQAELVFDRRQSGSDIDVYVADSSIHVTWFSYEDNSVYYLQGRPCSAAYIDITTTQTEVCQGNSLTLEASSNGMVQWFENANIGTPVAEGNSFNTQELNAPSIFYARTIYCGTSSELDSITIWPTIMEQPQIISNNGVLNAIPAIENASYSWYTCNDSLVLSQDGVSYTPENAADVFVTYTLSGCEASSNCFNVIVTSDVSSNEGENRYRLTSDKILFFGNKPIIWFILDTSGRVILSGFGSEVDYSKLKPGIYCLQTNVFTLKFAH